MPTKKLFGKTFDARPDRLDIRDLPYRAPLKSLPERYPSQDRIDKFLPYYSTTGMVLDQGKEGACTGFGLAAVVNYLKWEPWLIETLSVGKKPKAENTPPKISTRMLYQNARLYDEWKGDDYEGSSCRGAMKGFHKHGVCKETCWPYWDRAERNKPGKPQEGWREDAAQTPLGAYYRIDTGSIADLQAAIHEVHAIYVSASVHDGWRLGKCKTLAKATIPDPVSGETAGHAFALVGYTPDGFIVQNSWGPNWGFHGFGLLRYTNWSANASDAWVLALGAPIKDSKSPPARTAITLEERARFRSPLRDAEQARDKLKKESGRVQVIPWTKAEEANHIVFIGQGGRANRELVAAIDAEDAVRFVADEARKSRKKIAIYCHGGLNDRDEGVKRAQILGPWFMENGIHPIFVVWQTGFLECAKSILDAAPRALPDAAQARAQGRILEQIEEELDRCFEVVARDMGVKAIWEDMKNRAEEASAEAGGMNLLAAFLAQALGAQNVSGLHLLGHSAGVIMIGWFLAAMAKENLKANTIHLWAPACTVGFALATYAKAFGNGTANQKSTFVSVLTDENERADHCIPALYSKSLLYLVSRALERDHKTPLLGMHKVWTDSYAKDDAFKSNLLPTIEDWRAASTDVHLDRAIGTKEVPIRRKSKAVETIAANHGSFDNNLDVINLAIERITGRKPKVPVTDLKGF